jgi:hypothetical protein
MPAVNNVNANKGDLLLLVGTMKGAFVLRSDARRSNWEVGGPYFPGRAIYALAYDDRNGRRRLWAAVNSSYWGSYLSSPMISERAGASPKRTILSFPKARKIQ